MIVFTGLSSGPLCGTSAHTFPPTGCRYTQTCTWEEDMIRYNSIDVYSFKRYRLELLSNQRPTPKRQSFHIYGEGFVCSSNTDTGAGREVVCWLPAGGLGRHGEGGEAGGGLAVVAGAVLGAAAHEAGGRAGGRGRGQGELALVGGEAGGRGVAGARVGGHVPAGPGHTTSLHCAGAHQHLTCGAAGCWTGRDSSRMSSW